MREKLKFLVTFFTQHNFGASLVSLRQTGLLEQVGVCQPDRFGYSSPLKRRIAVFAGGAAWRHFYENSLPAGRVPLAVG